MRVPAQPDLVDADGDRPRLHATRCEVCGRVAFPPLSIGCDACGAPENRLTPITVAAAGVVHASATVHRHHGEPPVPFTIVDVHLDAGPIVRAMAAPPAGGLQVGEAVVARWNVVSSDDGGNDVVEPAFEPVPAGVQP